MTGQKNRFSTTEKLWNLDDKQLKTPEHDAMVAWLMDENHLKPLIKPLMQYEEKYGFFSKKFNKDKIIHDSVTIDSEVPLYSSPTFIGGYADFIIEWGFKSGIENYPCPIDPIWADSVDKTKNLEDMNLLLQKYWNDENFDMKQYCSEEEYSYSSSNNSFNYYDKNGNEISYYDWDYGWPKKRKKSSISWSTFHANANDVRKRKFYDFIKNINVDYPCSKSSIKTWIEADFFYNKYKYGFLQCLIEVKPYIDSFGAVLRQIKTYTSFWRDRRGQSLICLFTLDDRFDSQFESQGINVLHPPEDVTIDDMRDMYDLW